MRIAVYLNAVCSMVNISLRMEPFRRTLELAEQMKIWRTDLAIDFIQWLTPPMAADRTVISEAWRDSLAGVSALPFVIKWYWNEQLGSPLNIDAPKSSRKAQFDALLLTLPGVSARKINGLDAYFVSDKMFACISGDGVGLRLPAAIATELQFSRENVVPFQPGGMASSKEWIQIDRVDSTEYEKDLQLFRDSIEFVKAGRTR